MAAPDISVIVRARDEATSIGRCLELLGAQDTAGRSVETIVVDSGSRDRTVEIATAAGAQVLRIAPGQFTFGRALNLGCEGAGGALLVSLSAHAFLHDRNWLARLAEQFVDPRVACACGEQFMPDGRPLTARVEQDRGLLEAEPAWGYSNAAGGFRAELWRERPFREDLPGCEDKEWARHWIERGRLCVLDPALTVDHDHTHDPVRSIFERARREAEGFSMFLELEPYRLADLVREWWSDLRFYRSPLRARLSHRRAARLLGAYAGRRARKR